MTKLAAFEDPNHDGNSAKYHTDEPCIVKGCDKPAGTWWSKLWCFEHNVERMKRIDRNLTEIAADYGIKIKRARAAREGAR